MNTIQSSISTAQEQKEQIESKGSSIALNSVTAADVVGVTAHENCEQLYTDMKAALKSYSSQIETDAKHITDIAWGLDNLDKDMSKELKNKK